MQRDKFLYGHPDGGYYQSCPQFFPHFMHLMTEDAGPCSCALCQKEARRS